LKDPGPQEPGGYDETMVLCVKNLRVSGILGVHEEERRRERDIVINVRLEYDASKAVRTDSLDDALDYKRIRDCIVAVVQETKSKLLETLAEVIAQELSKDVRISRLQLEVDKPNALRLAESVSAVITWERGAS
jgi:D-erythro-7,8-dihydroneopterin triphosphate epimerase